MWVNVLLFLVAVATAVYFYLTRNFGWFKARGVYEHEPAFPFGCAEAQICWFGQPAHASALPACSSWVPGQPLLDGKVDRVSIG